MARLGYGSERLQDRPWCEPAWCKEQNIQANYCDPGSPWQNGRIESFNSRLRDELLTREVFDSMGESVSCLNNTATTTTITAPIVPFPTSPQSSTPLNGGPKTAC